MTLMSGKRIGVLLCALLTFCSALAAEPIRVGQFAGATSVRACLESPEFRFADIVWDKNSTNWSYGQWSELLNHYQVVVFPGGSGGEMFSRLGHEGQRAVKDYVNKGGGYLGICAGAWLATRRYLGIANIEGIAPWYVGAGGLEVAMGEEATNVFASALYQAPARRTIEMHNGPMWSFQPPDRARPAFHVLASYTGRGGTNKTGGEFFKGKPAIVTDAYGQGRVILFSPHPELVSTNGNGNMIPEAVHWLVNTPSDPGTRMSGKKPRDNPGKAGGRPASPGSEAAECTANSCVVAHEGGLPIIISAPHGGGLAFAGADVRKGGGGVRQFAVARDVNTDALALELSAALRRETGKAPFLVVAKVSRKYVDLNRPENDAFESQNLRGAYEAYHAALEKYCREVSQKWGGGLLLDLHGQGVRSDSIFRGTRNGATTALLLKKYGDQALTAPQGLQGLLEAKGFKIIPSCASGKKESWFDGGYIVGKYGMEGSYGVDAIQLEFGGVYTANRKLPETATALAQVLSNYVAAHFPPQGQ